MELFEAIKGRRSIRRYKPDMPSEDDIRFIFEAARWAPSWANTQCWEFIVVRDQQTKALLAGTLPDKNPARPALSQAPIILVACAKRRTAGYFKGSAVTDKGDWMLFDAALALQNLTLAAYSRGLGTVHVGFFDALKAAAVLRVPADVAVIELLPCGYPETEGTVTPRKQIEEFVFYDEYGKRQGG